MRDSGVKALVLAAILVFILYMVTRDRSPRETDPPLSPGEDGPDIWIPWTVDEEGMHVVVEYKAPPLLVASVLPFAFWPNSYNRGKFKGDPTKTVINRESWHRAVDVRALRSTPAIAVLKTEVIDCGISERGGFFVRLLAAYIPPAGMEFYYAHLDEEPIVEIGQVVEAGQIIGAVGNTGNAIHTKCHLHFQQKLHRGKRGYARFPNPYPSLLQAFGTNRRWPKDTPACTKKRETCSACLPKGSKA